VTCATVEYPATGDQPEGGVVGLAVYQVSRKVVLRISADFVHPENRDLAIGAGDEHPVLRLQVSELVEHRRSLSR